MKNIITLILMMITISSYSQMVKTKHGWSYYSELYSFQKYGEKATPTSGRTKLSFNKNNNGLMLIYSNEQIDTFYLTQVDPVFISQKNVGYKYNLHEMLNYKTYMGLRFQIIFAEKTIIRLFYPNEWREYSY
jgi:hypothetical protein